MSDVTDEACEMGELADSKLTNLPECKTAYDAACEEGTKLCLYGEELCCHAMAHSKVLVVEDIEDEDEVRAWSALCEIRCYYPAVSPHRDPPSDPTSVACWIRDTVANGWEASVGTLVTRKSRTQDGVYERRDR